ncbi:hypothetical protein [Bacillus sp. USDA818B3_A]|uniref:hypothetical protein n=1 Tax=Bacillus sp. USDA818B3_A TaxID=2698834 RepID=UPI00136A1206|nr:hypothetical protein [Bacillus sp. USDA818B3_A]
MRELVGIFIAVQAILTGLILHGMNSISDSILMASAYQKSDDITISWGGHLGTGTYILLGAIVVVGALLILFNNKKSK